MHHFHNYRDGSYFEGLWKDVLNTAEQCNIETEPAPKQKTKQSSKLQGYITMSQLAGRSESTKDTFHTSIFCPVLDSMLCELNRRFSKPICEIIIGIQALNPTSATFCQEEALSPFASIYSYNIDDLRHELYQIKIILERKVQAGIQKPICIVDSTVLIEPYKEVFHELFRLCKITVAILVSTAACERSFFTFKLVKSYLRSTMNEDRLSNLGLECRVQVS